MRRRIQEHLDKLGMTQKDLAEKLGVNDSSVSMTISGSRHNSTVLNKLRELGVPERYLNDPHQGEAA